MNLITRKELLEKLKMKNTLFSEILNEGSIPKPVKIGPRKHLWIESEIDEWVLSLPRSSHES